MESQDSSAPPPHHHHQPPLPAVFVNPHAQTLQHHQIPNNSYSLPNNNNNNHNRNNSVIPANSNATMMQQQNPGFPFNSMPQAASKPLDHHYSDDLPSGGGGFSIEPARKKRGRPRKYSPDNSIGLGLSPVNPGGQISAAMVVNNDSGGGGGGASATPSSDTAGKRNRGRPPGSVKKQLDALGLPGVGFTPHVILVNKGEDIASKIMAFSQQGPRTVCILSAYGAVSNVTLRQAAMSGGTVTYEGRFEIISLSGSFMLVESNGNRSRSGALSVSLAGSDGRVLGGGVAGMLKADTPVQVIVGSFIADGKKPKALRLLSSPIPSSNMLNFSAPVTKTSSSPDASSESADENDDGPVNHGSGPYNTDSGQPIQNMPPPVYSNMGWPNSMKMQ